MFGEGARPQRAKWKQLRALVISAIMIVSVFAVAVSFSGVAAANTAGNVSLSLNSAGNQATVTVEDPDLNTAGNTVESTVVNVESDSEGPAAGSKQTASDTSDSSTQTISISPASRVADRNNDGSITAADFTLNAASDESISDVSLDGGAYDVTIEDSGGSNTDSNAETVTYTKLTAEVTSSDTGDGSSTTLTTDKPVADRNGDGDTTEADVKLTGAPDESITSFSTNSNGTATLTISDSGSPPTDSTKEQIAYLRREPVTLSETGQDTGKFTGIIDIEQSDSDGALKAQDGDSITTIYWEDGTTKRIDSKTLSLNGGDTTAPSISSVSLGESSGNMDISFDSDEQLGTNSGDVAVTVIGPSPKTYSFDRTDFTASTCRARFHSL